MSSIASQHEPKCNHCGMLEPRSGATVTNLPTSHLSGNLIIVVDGKTSHTAVVDVSAGADVKLRLPAAFCQNEGVDAPVFALRLWESLEEP